MLGQGHTHVAGYIVAPLPQCARLRGIAVPKANPATFVLELEEDGAMTEVMIGHKQSSRLGHGMLHCIQCARHIAGPHTPICAACSSSLFSTQSRDSVWSTDGGRSMFHVKQDRWDSPGGIQPWVLIAWMIATGTTNTMWCPGLDPRVTPTHTIHCPLSSHSAELAAAGVITCSCSRHTAGWFCWGVHNTFGTQRWKSARRTRGAHKPYGRHFWLVCAWTKEWRKLAYSKLTSPRTGRRPASLLRPSSEH